MKLRSVLFVFSLILVGIIISGVAIGQEGQGPEPQSPEVVNVSTSFTYQGQLKDGGSPINGKCDFQFELYNAATAGTKIGSTLTKSNVDVVDGRFTVALDFGASAFPGANRWLLIKVRCPAGSGTYTTLAPRQKLTAVPYALSANTLDGQDSSAFSLTGHTHFGATWSGSNTTYGLQVRNTSASGAGIYGFGTGRSASDAAGWADAGGLFAAGNGVVGVTNSSNLVAVIGDSNHASGWAGVFSSTGHGVQIGTPAGKTGLTVSGGTKNAVVAIDNEARLLYTEESTEVWFTDYGFGQLSGGVEVVTIDPLYAKTVNLNEPYHVFTEVYGPNSMYVSNRTPTQFEVRSIDGGEDVEFSYRIVARRLGYEDDRLERAPWADYNENLFPDKLYSFDGTNAASAPPGVDPALFQKATINEEQ